jgi:drug/metabolite transporter (DMT)-like permease
MFLVWIVSSTWLHERVDGWILGGVSLLLVGLLFANDARRSANPAADGRAIEQPLATSYLAAAFIAIYHLAYGRALARGAAPAPLFGGALFVALPIVVLAIGQKSPGAAWLVLKKRPVPIICAGILATASFVVFLVGLSRSGPGVAITVRNTSIAFAQGFAWLMGERINARQAAGAVLVVVGAALVGYPH